MLGGGRGVLQLRLGYQGLRWGEGEEGLFSRPVTGEPGREISVAYAWPSRSVSSASTSTQSVSLPAGTIA